MATTIRAASTIVVAFMTVVVSVFAAAPTASAHAELVQSSPRADSVVGGEFHSIALQFIGLDTDEKSRAELLDPAGKPIGQMAVQEDMRIVIPIEPLTVPGTYTVSYSTIGVDGDLSSGMFTFRYQPGEPAPEGITIEISAAERFGWFGYGLILAIAALLAYLAHRFRMAWRDHQHARSDR